MCFSKQFPHKPPFFYVNELECRLIASRIAFQKLMQAPRGKQLKIDGIIVNVPAEVSTKIIMMLQRIHMTSNRECDMARSSVMSHVSKVKPSSNVFDCHVQTDEQTVVRVFCFSPDKRTNLHEVYQNKSPVKIKGVKSAEKKKRYHEGIDEFTITRSAKISPSTTKFQFIETFANRR